MTRMNISVEVPERRGHKFPGLNWWPATTSSWVKVGFVVAFALAATAFAIFGIGERGTTIALRLTARWSFVLFWLAYTGGPMARLFGPRLAGVARRGRDFGLADAPGFDRTALYRLCVTGPTGLVKPERIGPAVRLAAAAVSRAYSTRR